MSENKCPNLCCGNMQRIAELEAQETEWAQKIADQALQIGGLEMDLDIAAEQHATLALLRAENKSLREQLERKQKDIDDRETTNKALWNNNGELLEKLGGLQEQLARMPVVVGYVSPITIDELRANPHECYLRATKIPNGVTQRPIYIDPQPQEVKG